MRADRQSVNYHRSLALRFAVWLVPFACDVPSTVCAVWDVSAGGNGHNYELVTSPNPISWTQARDAAVAAGGYLATISSSAENAFVASIGSSNLRWIGAYQRPGSPEPAGGWIWVTGERFTYANWYYSEPNNGGGGSQDYAVMWDAGSWVDSQDFGEGGWATSAYVIEYSESVVSNVRAGQQPETKLVEIKYDLATGGGAASVAVAVSTNGGASYDLPANHFTGDVGSGVSPGADRLVIWNAGADWNAQFSTAVRFKVTASAGSAPQGFVLIPAGSFQMGDTFNEGDGDERPVHTVSVSAFYMQATETTKAQWDEVRAWASTHGYTDLPIGAGKASNHPVQMVSWCDVVK